MDARDWKTYLSHMEIGDVPEVLRPIAEKMGLEKFMELSEYLGGTSLYIPNPEKVLIMARNRMILAEYPRLGFAEIARKHKLCESWVRVLIRENQA